MIQLEQPLGNKFLWKDNLYSSHRPKRQVIKKMTTGKPVAIERQPIIKPQNEETGNETKNDQKIDYCERKKFQFKDYKLRSMNI